MFERKKLKPGQKSLWDQMGRNTEQEEPEEVEQPELEEEKKPERFKMIKGIVRGGGLKSVFKKGG